MNVKAIGNYRPFQIFRNYQILWILWRILWIICGYYGAFQTLRVAIRTCKVYNKQEKDFKISFLSSVKIFLAHKRPFCFFFSSGRLLHQRRTKANDARRIERRLHAMYLFSRKNLFF